MEYFVPLKHLFLDLHQVKVICYRCYLRGCSHMTSAKNGWVQTPPPPLSAKVRNSPTPLHVRCYVLCVMCHVSCVMCQVSGVRYQVACITFFFDKLVGLVGGRAVITGAYPN